MKQALYVTLGLMISGGTHAQQAAFDPGIPAPQVPSDYYATAEKVAIQINTGPDDNQMAESFYLKLLNNINNYHQAVNKFSGKAPEIRVIIHGDGIGLLTQAQDGSAKLAGRLDELRAKGVQFQVCYNTLLGKKIPLSALYKVSAEDMVPAGVAELARLQGLGFAYLKL